MTISKRNGKYYCRFQLNGERHHKLCAGATSIKEAEKIENAFKYKLQQIQNGVIPKEEKNLPLYKLKQIYLAYSETNNRNFEHNKYSVNIIMAYFGENKIAQDILPKHIEAFKEWLRTERNLKNASINRYLEILSKMFNLGIDNGNLSTNPVSKVKKLQEDNHKIRFLTVEEEVRLYKALPEFLKPIVTVALHTGMRRGEILNLKWSNIDFDYGFIELLQTKSGKARKIPISEKLMEIFNNLHANTRSEYVFINPETGLPYVDIKKSFNKAREAAGIKNFRFHDLRHTVATRLVEKGIDLLVVMDILGHSKIETTMRYAHPLPKRKSDAISVLNSYN